MLLCFCFWVASPDHQTHSALWRFVTVCNGDSRYAFRPVGAEGFEEATPAYRIMTAQEACYPVDLKSLFAKNHLYTIEVIQLVPILEEHFYSNCVDVLGAAGAGLHLKHLGDEHSGLRPTESLPKTPLLLPTKLRGTWSSKNHFTLSSKSCGAQSITDSVPNHSRKMLKLDIGQPWAHSFEPSPQPQDFGERSCERGPSELPQRSTLLLSRYVMIHSCVFIRSFTWFYVAYHSTSAWIAWHLQTFAVCMLDQAAFHSARCGSRTVWIQGSPVKSGWTNWVNWKTVGSSSL